MLFACRSKDEDTLRHAVLALASFCIYGGSPGQQEMVRTHAVDWLLPLAVHSDDLLCYYALLTFVLLLCNRFVFLMHSNVYQQSCLKVDTFKRIHLADSHFLTVIDKEFYFHMHIWFNQLSFMSNLIDRHIRLYKNNFRNTCIHLKVDIKIAVILI